LLDQAYEVEKKIQKGEIIKVGVNRFTDDEEQREVEVVKHGPEILTRQIERLNRVKATRDKGKVIEYLKDLKKAATEERNIMPCLIDAVKAYATMGEIVGVLKEVHGEAEQPRFI